MMEKCDERSKKMLEYIDNLVEVVRCKDCKLERICEVGQYLGEDGYCSKGERERE